MFVYCLFQIGVTVLSRIQAKVLTETRPGDGILLNACCPGWVRTDMAGSNATKSPEEGAETPVYLTMLPEGAKEPHGQLVWDKTVQEWQRKESRHHQFIPSEKNVMITSDSKIC